MNKKLVTFLLVILTVSNLFTEEILIRNDGSQIIVYEDHTWGEYTDEALSSTEIINKNKSSLRNGISTSETELLTACEMYEQGWAYNMPRPKSSKAAWGISDGRTTQYNGWWYNSKTRQYSDSTPRKSSSGLFLGDNQNSEHSWKKGGSPRRPDIYMFLLSKNGGPHI